jgi:DNA-binding winged helix-turn-helix (wHTH) protein/TolB-like protein/thioredoxin-like negative regulator of GroEL
MDGGDPAEYRFDDVLVDTRARRVFKGGVEIPLEPKAYAVLLELLREPQVAIGRDRLLDAVWGHRFVTPGVLNRIIAILRRALGDDADHPRLIRTVHGVGYSFIGLPAGATAPAAAGPTPQDLRAGEMPRPAPAAKPRRRLPHWGILVPSLLLCTAAIVLAWQRTHDEPVPGPETHVARLALLPVVPASTGDEVLARGLTDVLAEALARIPEIELIEIDSARVAVSRSDDPTAVAGMLGTDHLLRGRIGQRGEQVRLELELLRGSDGRSEWREEFLHPRASLTSVLDPVLAAVRSELLPDQPPGPLDPIVRATALAQSLYLESRSLREFGPEDRARNVALLERAVADDPDFALGWAALANARRARYQHGDTNLKEAMTGAQEAIDRALALDPDLVEALVVQCFIKTNQWRTAEALAPSRRAYELAPNDPRAVGVRANVLGYLGRPRESLALRQRAVELNPLWWGPVWSMATDYLMLGDRERALAQIAAARGMVGGENDAGVFGARLELAFGQPAQALLRFRQGLPSQVSFSIILRTVEVQALAAIGQVEQAEALLDSLEVRLPEVPAYVDARLTLLWAAGRFEEALAWLEGDGRNAAMEPWQTVARAHARALAGDVDGALADYASALEGPTDRHLVFHNWWPTRFGPASLANWIALSKQSGREYRAEIDDLTARLDEARANGTRAPTIFYYRALLAALRDDPASADAALTEARERGWFDPVALQVDLAWRPYRESAWFEAQRRSLEDKAARERALLATGTPGDRAPAAAGRPGA